MLICIRGRDLRGDCPVRSSGNGDFSSVGIERKTPPLGSGKKHPSPRILRIHHFLIFVLYLKILGIYFTMHYEIFWLWVLYDYTFFCYTLCKVLALRFFMIISSQILFNCFDFLWFSGYEYIYCFDFSKRTWNFLFYFKKKGINNVISLS
jgi:hypothetical protein